MGTHRTAPQDLRAAVVDAFDDGLEAAAWMVSACEYVAAGAPISPAKRAALLRAATRQEIERATATMRAWNATAGDRASLMSDPDPLIAEQAHLVDKAFTGAIGLDDAKRVNASMQLAAAIAAEPQLVRQLVDRGVSPRNVRHIRAHGRRSPHHRGAHHRITRTTARPRGAGRPRARRVASSSRSSSDDGPGSSDEPPPAERLARHPLSERAATAHSHTFATDTRGEAPRTVIVGPRGAAQAQPGEPPRWPARACATSLRPARTRLGRRAGRALTREHA